MRLLSRRELMGMLVLATAGTALGACATPNPTPTPAPLAKATEMPTASPPPKPTDTIVPPTPTTAPTATLAPTATGTAMPTATLVSTPLATPQPGKILTYKSAKHGFSFDYPGEWVPMQPKDQLVIDDGLGIENVRLGVADGPWLLIMAIVLPSLPAFGGSGLADEIQMAKVSPGSPTVKLVSARVIEDDAMKLYAADMSLDVTRDSGSYQSRQITMRQGLNKVRVGFDVPKGTMEKHAAGLDKVLTTLKVEGLPSLKAKLPWVDVQL